MSCPFCRECDENFDHILSCPEGLICHINDKIQDISDFVNIKSNKGVDEKYWQGLVKARKV